ncbi:MAG TPA: PP2C family protein-serine/threonine phosphatase [Holophagaceae bacterium]|nr:PP2C family protein-serine/threonine phosphatase [Holophagaceae bacterium]
MNAVRQKLRERLTERREVLAALVEGRRERALVELVRRVDDAIGALEVGSWGTCTVCREAVSELQMCTNPLLSVCLDCMGPEDRRALERDLEGAARVQRALLPEASLAEGGWEVAYLWEPKGPVSGDHVDLIRSGRPEDPFHVLLGDVAGKGVSASFLQAHLHALFRALVPAGLPLADLLTRANGLFAEATLASKYATLAALRLHAGGLVELANAGHPRPLLADARGVRPVEGGGLPLGMFPEATFQTRALHLLPGQTLLLYTDGWTEGAKEDEEFGIGRAAATFRKAARLPLPDLLGTCREALDRFLGDTPRGDDLSLVALRRIA